MTFGFEGNVFIFLIIYEFIDFLMCLGFVPNDGKKKLVKELLKMLFPLSAFVQALSLLHIFLLGFVGI